MKKTFYKKFMLVALGLLLPFSALFAGCNNTVDAGKAIDSTVAMWEQVKTDATNSVVGSEVGAMDLAIDTSGLILSDGLNADKTGVGQLLCFDFITAGLYVAQTMIKDSNYTLGEVFSGTSIISDETANSYESYGSLAGIQFDIPSAVINLNKNIISGEMLSKSPFGFGVEGEFNFYTQFEATFDTKTYAITDFKIVFYDNSAQGAGEQAWYFTGVTYNAMKGVRTYRGDNTSESDLQFMNAVKGRGNNLYKQTATVKDKDFSSEINEGFVYGAQLVRALLALGK